MGLWDGVVEVKSSEMRHWDGAEEVKLPRCGFGMRLRGSSSRDEALGWSCGGEVPEMGLWDEAEEVKLPRRGFGMGLRR